MKKALLAVGAVTTLGLAGIVGTSAAFAHSAPGGVNSLVDTIAQRFNLNKDEVQKVFDEERTAREAEHQKNMQDRLQQAVKDGKLTQEQADKITAKQKEMEEFRKSLKDKTPEERRQAMKAKHAELKQWLKDNNIPAPFLHGGEGGHKGPGMMPQEQ